MSPPASCNTISKRICQEGHANALALNRDCTQIAVAGRSRTHAPADWQFRTVI